MEAFNILSLDISGLSNDLIELLRLFSCAWTLEVDPIAWSSSCVEIFDVHLIDRYPLAPFVIIVKGSRAYKFVVLDAIASSPNLEEPRGGSAARDGRRGVRGRSRSSGAPFERSRGRRPWVGGRAACRRRGSPPSALGTAARSGPRMAHSLGGLLRLWGAVSELQPSPVL